MGITAPVAAEGAAKAAPAVEGAAKGAEGVTAATAGAGAAEAGADVLAPALAGAAGAGAGLAGSAAASGAPLNILPDIAVPGTADAIQPAGGALASNLATEPAFASSVPDLNAIAGPGVSSANSALPASAQPASFSPPAASGPAPAAPGATNFSAPAGAAPQLSADPTASAAASGLQGATGATTGAASNGILSSITSALSPNNLVKGLLPDLSKPGSLLGPLVAGGGLAYSVLQGQKQTAANNALVSQASQANANAQPLIAQGEQLAGYLQSGTLPPGYQSQVDQAIQSAKTNAISNAAAQGLSTDPTKNTALAATLSQIDQQGPIISANLAQQLLTAGNNLISTGVTASGLASNVYTTLAQIDQSQTAQTAKSIASLAAALSGKSAIPGTNISVSSS